MIQAIDAYPDSASEMHYNSTEKRVWGLEQSVDSIKEFQIYSESLLALLFKKEIRCDKVLAYSNHALPKGEEYDYLLNGRWHQDSLRSQFKVFLFLDSVSIDSGAFQILTGSHKKMNKLKSLMSGNVIRPSDFLSSKRAYQSFDDRWISRLCATYPEQSLVSDKVSGYIVNTSAIHRAAPCNRGSRYALCSYFRHF